MISDADLKARAMRIAKENAIDSGKTIYVWLEDKPCPGWRISQHKPNDVKYEEVIP